MSLPKVIISYSNKNLLAAIDAIDGICAIVGTAATVGLQGVPSQVFSVADAEDKGFTEAAEPVFHRHIKEFYDEVGGEQELWLMGVPAAMLMADMLDNSELNGAIKVIKAANGAIRTLGVFRTGAKTGAVYIDTDVSDAVLAAKTFCEARLAELIPIRVLIEGRINDENNATVYEPKTAGVGYAGVVLGGSAADGSASIGTALGRRSKYGAHIKLGKVANGPLAIKTAYIGTKPIAGIAGLATLHGKGYISFMQHPNKAGIYFGIDRMASLDDFRLLVYGGVIDKAAVIAAAVYVEELESEVDVDPVTGFLNEIDIEHLKGIISQQINKNMGAQISGVSIFIDPKQDIINTGVLKVKVKVTPKGYTSEIEVELGLNAPLAA
jgi:hypothetical protein